MAKGLGAIITAAVLAGSGIAAPATAQESTPTEAAFTVTTGADGGPGSYRQAVIDASAVVDGPDIINFDPGLVITLTSGDVAYTGTEDLTLNGNGSSIDGDGNQILAALDAPSVTVDELTLVNGDSAPDGGPEQPNGGGIELGSGDISVTDSTIDNNTAGRSGGGIYTDGGNVTVERSMIVNNTADRNGAGIYTLGGDVTVGRSTLDGNSASLGGAIYASGGGTVTITESTLSNNDTLSGDGDGGAIWGASGTDATIVNSTLANNAAKDGEGAVGVFGDMSLVYATVTSNSSPTSQIGSSNLTTYGSVISDAQGGGTNCEDTATTSLGHNYSTDASCELAAGTDVEAAGDPQLQPLTDNGGPTQTREPAVGSPLVDAIPALDCDVTVVEDQRGESRPFGVGCDIGAVEVTPAAIRVTNGADGGAGSYRQAMLDASVAGALAPVTVEFDPDLEVVLTSDDVAYTGAEALTLVGADSSIDGGGSHQILEATSGADVEIRDLEMTGGAASNGGAVEAAGRVIISESSFVGNAAMAAGGAVSSSGPVTVANSTLAGNEAVTGGAISSSGEVDATHATFAGNEAETGAQVSAGSLVSAASVFAEPIDGSNCSIAGASSSGDHNYSTDGSCSFGESHDVVSVADPLLGVPRDNGSPRTMFPLNGSPLVDAIDSGDCDATLVTDERGVSRPFGSGCDIGAIEAVFAAHGFSDVTPFYEAAVRWTTSTVNSPQILLGFDDGTFRHPIDITRGQVVRLYYRMAGAPDVTGLPEHGFSDVTPFYEDAVRWAKANSVFDGFPDNTFRQSRNIRRGNFARSLHGLAGEPDVSTEPDHGFSDVTPFYEEGVTWAKANGLADGFPDNTFRQQNPISRGNASRLAYNVARSPDAWNQDIVPAPANMLFRPNT